MVTLDVNGQRHSVPRSPDTPLLWVLREDLSLKGTKYGCGIGVCGICSIHVDGEARHACVTTVGEVVGKKVVTIEGLAQRPDRVFSAWIAEQASQCGYCQPGQIMTAAALLARSPSPTDDEINAAMSKVLCRCGTYQRIRGAIRRAALGKTPAVGHGKEQTSTGSAAEVIFNRWLRIAADGTITVIIDRSEMGQGVMTGLAMLAAEELEIDLAQLRTEFAPAHPHYFNAMLGEQMTGGSTSVRAAWMPLREAAAQTRQRLVAAAAATWKVPQRECRAEQGAIVHLPTRRRLGYGDLAASAAAQLVPSTVRLKQPEAFRLIGTSPPRLDIPDHISGRTVFGSDVSIPGMLGSVVARAPVFGGKTKAVATIQTRAIEGVHEVVELQNGVAVVADNIWSALRGREALQVIWDEGQLATLGSEDIGRRFAHAATCKGRLERDDGDVDAALGKAATVIEAVYETPYLAHATMEPMNCTARVGTDGCDVWAPTQAQTEAQRVAADAAGLPCERVRIHTMPLGGGFGRRLDSDFVGEAVRIAKAIGRPVQVLWTRDDDMHHDHYRPANYTRLQASLDKRGAPLAWFQRIVGPPLALDGVDFPYAIPNVREEHVTVDPGIPTGPWRSVGASQNAFVIESFIDELAHAAAADPFTFRQKLLRKSPRHRAVLQLAAEKAGWMTPPPHGRHRGVAVYHSFGSYVAQVAEVSINASSVINVHRVICAIDCGIAVNPDLIAAQMEGAIAFGLSAALKGEITIEHGRVVQANFKDYPILTLAEMPRVEVHIIARQDEPGGVGEPGVPPIAPAVANAVFAATGCRVRHMPLRLTENGNSHQHHFDPSP
jgi:isoquinoline 1-oxidoreductase beta subunit